MFSLYETLKLGNAEPWGSFLPVMACGYNFMYNEQN